MASTNNRTGLKIIYLCLAFAGLFYLAFDANRDINIYDEGVAVYGAQRVISGELPYRDFWTMYPPGNFYLLAALLKIFGNTLATARIWSVVVMWMLVIGAGFLARRISNPLGVLVASGIVMTAAGSYGFYAQPVPTALVLSLAAAFFLMRYLENLRIRNLWLSGIFIGLATLVRHDVGFYVFLAHLFILIPFHLFILIPANVKTASKGTQTIKGIAPLACGILAIVMPAAIIMAVFIPIREMIDCLIFFPLKVYPKVRALPYPSILPDLGIITEGGASAYLAACAKRLPFYFPLGVYIASAFRLFREAKKNPEKSRSSETRIIVFLIFLGLFLHYMTIIRSAPPNLLPTTIPAAVLFAHLVSKIGKLSKKSLGYWIIAVCLLTALTAPPLRGKAYALKLRLTGHPWHGFTIEKGAGILWDERTPDYEKAIRFVRKHTDENEKILVANERNDRIFINDVLFYFLADRPSCTKFHELHPGLATTHEVQNRIAGEIESKRVRAVVLRREEYSESPGVDGARLLDDYIQQNFALAKRFGDYSIWLRQPVTIGESLAQ